MSYLMLSKSPAISSLGVGIVACSIGLFLPGYYDWSGADQSRPSPWIPGALIFLLSLATLGSLVLGLRYFYSREPSKFPIIGSWYPMVWVVFCVVVVAGIRGAGWLTLGLALSFVPLVSVYVWGISQAFSHSRLRWPWMALLLGGYGPFLWLFVGKYTQFKMPEIFLMLTGVPMLLPAGYLSMLLGWNWHEWMWMGNGLMSMAIGVGIVLMQRGEKRVLAYTLFLCVVSVASSLGLHALIRA